MDPVDRPGLDPSDRAADGAVGMSSAHSGERSRERSHGSGHRPGVGGPGLRRATGALVALTAFLLVFGSTVRVHGAGLACPDWPLCFGEVVPAYDFKVYLEFGHRVVAGFVSLGFVGVGVALARTGLFRRRRDLLGLWVAAAAVLGVQVVLGGLTVLELLAEWTVASHLVTGNTFAALLLALALGVAAPARLEGAATGTVARALAAAALLMVPFQIVLGGLVAGSHAGLACGTWPSCNGAGWFPTLQGLVGLQVVHRITAYTLAGLVFANLAAHWRHPAARRPALLMSVVVLIQIAIGVANVLLRLPMEVTLLHSAGAAALFLSTTWLQHVVWRSPLAEPVGSAPVRPLSRPLEAK